MRNSSNKKTDESTVKQLRDKLATAELEILNLKGQNILLQEQNQELKYKQPYQRQSAALPQQIFVSTTDNKNNEELNNLKLKCQSLEQDLLNQRQKEEKIIQDFSARERILQEEIYKCQQESNKTNQELQRFSKELQERQTYQFQIVQDQRMTTTQNLLNSNLESEFKILEQKYDTLFNEYSDLKEEYNQIYNDNRILQQRLMQQKQSNQNLEVSNNKFQVLEVQSKNSEVRESINLNQFEQENKKLKAEITTLQVQLRQIKRDENDKKKLLEENQKLRLELEKNRSVSVSLKDFQESNVKQNVEQEEESCEQLKLKVRELKRKIQFLNKEHQIVLLERDTFQRQLQGIQSQFKLSNSQQQQTSQIFEVNQLNSEKILKCCECSRVQQQLKELQEEYNKLKKLFDIKVKNNQYQKEEIQRLKGKQINLENTISQNNELQKSNQDQPVVIQLQNEGEMQRSRIQNVERDNDNQQQIDELVEQLAVWRRKCTILEKEKMDLAEKMREKDSSSNLKLRMTQEQPIQEQRRMFQSYQSMNGYVSNEQENDLRNEILAKQLKIEELKTQLYLVQGQSMK